MTNVLRVRNVAQKVLWENELSGQISDGHWENSSPHDHWEAWCRATVIVDPVHVGRDFYARRESYNFTSKDLLDVVGERMIEAVRQATGDQTYDMKRMKADLIDLKSIIKQKVHAAQPVPQQPASRKAKLIVDGYPQSFTVYYDVEDDPRAVQEIAKRERKQKEYQLERLETQYAEARAKADAIGVQAMRLRDELEAELEAQGRAALEALATVKI